MDFFIDLLKVISKKKLQNIEILDKTLLSNKDSLYSKFYHGILEDLIKDDNDAVVFLYGDDSETSLNNYRQFKYRFKKRILNTLFFLDLSNKEYNTKIQKDYFEGIKSIYEVDIIQKFGGNNSLVHKIITDNYNIAKKYKFYNILAEYSNKLINYYTLEANYNQVQKEKEKYIKYSNLTKEENLAFILFNEVNILTSDDKPNTKLIQKKQAEVDTVIKNSESELTKIYAYMTMILLDELSLNYDSGINNCHNVLNLLSKRDFLIKQSYTSLVNYFIIRMKYQQRDFYNCEILIEQIKDKMFGLNWFMANEIRFKIALNNKEFKLAKHIYNGVVGHNLYNSLPSKYKEVWQIYNYSLQLYQSIIDNTEFANNIYTLINDCPTVFHDKSGFNFSLILLKIMYFINKQKLDEASQTIGTLRVYSSRYFKTKKHARNKVLINALIKLEKNNFESQINPFLNIKDPNEDILLDAEIIHYENLLSAINLMHQHNNTQKQ
ncbi:MAG: hypothetical protein H6553_10350 [Chitinophagales bacterium]|nr:hypothetical protein [Chitinophagales bacterium]